MSKLDLSCVPFLAERQAVAEVFGKFAEIDAREWAATKDLREQAQKIRDEIMAEARARADAATAGLDAQIEAKHKAFSAERDEVTGFPTDPPWRLHDDYCGVECCALSGLPLRQDDELLEDQHGESILACFLPKKDDA